MNTNALNTKSSESKKFAVIGNPIAHSRSPETPSRLLPKQQIFVSYDKILAPLDGFDASVQDFLPGGQQVPCHLNSKHLSYVMY